MPLEETISGGGGNDLIWQTSGIVTVGGDTDQFGEIGYETTKGQVTAGGDTSLQVNRRAMASTLQCCGLNAIAGGRVALGSATWHASTETDGDGLARYYPLWLNEHEVLEVTQPSLDATALALLQATGREIAHEIDAAGVAPIRDSENGKMCEIPEQFRRARYYEVPISIELDPQPDGLRTAPPVSPPVLQWEWARGFTMSLLYRYRPVRQEQTLFSLSPALRFGVSWLGELTADVQLANGAKLSAWSTQRLSTTDMSHIACTYDPHRRLVRMYLNGASVVRIELSRDLGAVDACYIGRWDGGSLMNGEAQDVRIYNSVLRTEFVSAETNSYCADWVEVVQ